MPPATGERRFGPYARSGQPSGMTAALSYVAGMPSSACTCARRMRCVVVSTLPTPKQLPQTLNKLTRGTVDLGYNFCDQIAKLIPFQPGKHITLKDAREMEPQLAERERNEEEVAELLALAEKLDLSLSI